MSNRAESRRRVVDIGEDEDSARPMDIFADHSLIDRNRFAAGCCEQDLSSKACVVSRTDKVVLGICFDLGIQNGKVGRGFESNISSQ